MKKKIVWMLVSCLMVLSLVMASCGPAEEEAEVEVGEEEIEVGEVKEEVEEEVVEEEGLLPPDVPKYGGTFTRNPVLPASNFNPYAVNHIFCGSVYLTNEELICGDWSKGPAGTGENDYFDGFGGQIKYVQGWLCESWDLPDDETIIFNIRRGVYWWDKPPLNGRELTAADVAWSLNKHFSSMMSYVYVSFGLAGMSPISVTALDNYTVEVKLPPGVQGMWLICVGDEAYIFPENITELVDMEDWRNAIGTSPWMLVDVVPDVSETYIKHPNYWQFDPVHPENRLPYPDRQINLTIPDASTAMAAFRTGKLDWTFASWEDAEMLLEDHPELEWTRMQTFGSAIHMRVDKPELPFDDLKVRRAMNMAVNKQEILDEYYGGNAVMLGYPVKTHKVWAPMYIPLEQMPASVQEVFTYDPVKARALLAEAGYPNGFKTKVACGAMSVDFLSLIREYYLDIGVDMEIDVKEGGAFFGVWMGRTHEEMILAAQKPEHPYMFYCEIASNFWDCSFWSDPRIDAAYADVKKYLGVNDAEIVRLLRETSPIILENCWGVFMPIPYNYMLWWPWYQNYRGEFDLCYNAQGRDRTFIWIDEELKKSMGY